MNNCVIRPFSLRGSIHIPGSKSMTHRALILAALSPNTVTINNLLLSEDTRHTIAALQALGVPITVDSKENSATVTGTNGHFLQSKKPIFVGNSGTTARLIIGLATLVSGTTTLIGKPRLFERPFDDFFSVLRQQGIHVEIHIQKQYIRVRSTGTIPGGKITISTAHSSQFASSLLLIGRFAEKPIQLNITNKKSQPYVDLTRKMIDQFAANPKRYTIETDFSSASYFLAANRLGANIVINNLPKTSQQPDARFAQIVRKIPNIIDMSEIPDSVPSLAICAAFQHGKKTIITNIAHLKGKESDRIVAISDNLNRMGIKTKTTKESLTIFGGKPHGAHIETHDDHRIAMSFAIAGCFARGSTIINNCDVVNKSFPDFWNALSDLCAQIIPVGKNTNIVLIGMRGSGKSSVARMLTRNLGKKLVEIDQEIENVAHKSIAEIVAKNGWTAFRALEKKLCHHMCTAKTNTVIATGGGTILDAQNVHDLQNTGLIVYLFASIATLQKRIGNDTSRPLLTNEATMKKDIAKTFALRKDIYEQTADIILRTDQLSIEEVVQKIQQFIV